jgi:hypothetical protein
MFLGYGVREFMDASPCRNRFGFARGLGRSQRSNLGRRPALVAAKAELTGPVAQVARAHP